MVIGSSVGCQDPRYQKSNASTTIQRSIENGSLRRRRNWTPPSAETLRATRRVTLRISYTSQPWWRICFERARDFVFWHNRRPLAYTSAGMVAVVAGAAVISVTIYQQPKPVQVVAESSPFPSTRPPNADGELHFSPPGFIQPFDMRPTLLPGSRDVPVLPIDSDQFVPLRLKP